MTDGLRLYDRLSDSVRLFSAPGPEVKIYICGVTPYDAMHLGHAFTFVSFDVLIRYLEFAGYRVRYVQNITDVDDPLFDKAQQLGVSQWDLAGYEIRQLEADLHALNVRPPDEFPRASEEVPRMVALIQRLLESGHAYIADRRVYFSVATDPEYGDLSRYSRAEMIEVARERGGDPDDPRKRDPLDFLLWRPARPEEPDFPSPWGNGLPGWHIECSTMAETYLGAPLDIHGGGSDLIFPHHENEIAQSEAANEAHPFARFWMHSGMVRLGGEKMSKSLGNMVFARQLVPEYGADAVRLYISSVHYRSPLDHNVAALRDSAGLARRLAKAASAAGTTTGPMLDPEPYRGRFLERMNDDLDTPGAIQALADLADAIEEAQRSGIAVESAQTLLGTLGGVLGLRLDAAAQHLGNAEAGLAGRPGDGDAP